MPYIFKVCLFVAVLFTSKVSIKCEPDWTFDFISVETENKMPDKIAVDLSITRPSRGVFALSGVIDFKEDVPEHSLGGADIYYSLMGSNFIKSPFYLPESNFNIAMNTFYKDYLMESMINCTDNAPLIKDKFVAPLTKRAIHLHDCIISNKNMPSKLKSGYYKIIYRYRNHAEGSVEVLIKVYNDW